MKVWMVKLEKVGCKYVVSLCDQFGHAIIDDDGSAEVCEWTTLKKAKIQANELAKHFGLAVTNGVGVN